jgi:chaperonin cofactor prefoldin
MKTINVRELDIMPKVVKRKVKDEVLDTLNSSVEILVDRVVALESKAAKIEKKYRALQRQFKST